MGAKNVYFNKEAEKIISDMHRGELSKICQKTVLEYAGRSDSLEIEHADIVNLETAHSPLLKYNAVFHGKLLLSFGEEKRRQFEFGIMQEHEDTEHLREAAYKILINRTIINNHK